MTAFMHEADIHASWQQDALTTDHTSSRESGPHGPWPKPGIFPRLFTMNLTRGHRPYTWRGNQNRLLCLRDVRVSGCDIYQDHETPRLGIYRQIGKYLSTGEGRS